MYQYLEVINLSLLCRFRSFSTQKYIVVKEATPTQAHYPEYPPDQHLPEPGQLFVDHYHTADCDHHPV